MKTFTHKPEPENYDLLCFVLGTLRECIKEAAPDVAKLFYYEDLTWGDGFRKVFYEQAVVITFDNGYQKVVNVHLDSKWGVIKDVMKAIES